MSYRFYTSREFARQRAEDGRRLAATDVTMIIGMGGVVTFVLKARAPAPVKIKMATPVQTELAHLIHLVPAERQHLARMFMRLKNASPKQLAACQRWVNRVKGLSV